MHLKKQTPNKDDPHKSLGDFLEICGTVKWGFNRCYSSKTISFFSLQDKAKDWLKSIPTGSIVTWDELAQAFSIISFRQKKRVGWEWKSRCLGRRKIKDCSNQLLRKYLRRGYPDRLQVQIFCNGSTCKTKFILDTVAAGSLFSKTAEAAHALLEEMASTTHNGLVERSTSTISRL